MSELGAFLKKAREQRGYSLDDLQDMTKIRKRYLEAIEEGNYAVLPGSFYVRAFVKNVAEAVGLDAEEVLRVYQKDIPSSPTLELSAEQPVLKPRRSSGTHASDRLSKWGFRLLMWGFIIVIAVVVYVYAIQKETGDGTRTADDGTKITEENNVQVNESGNTDVTDNTGANVANETNAANNAAPPPADEPPAPPVTTLTLTEPGTRMDTYAVAPAGPHTYEITVVGEGEAWVEMRRDSDKGEIVQNKAAKTGEIISESLDTTVYLSVGRADLVEVKVDGQLMEDGDKPRAKRYLFEPEQPAGTDTAGTTAP